MELKRFLQEEAALPPDRRISVSPCFRGEDGKELLWTIRAITEAEYRKRAEESGDRWAALCAAAVVFPDLEDRGLLESYGVKTAEEALKAMLYPGEYLRLLEEVRKQNGFGERKKAWREQAKNSSGRA